jgi:hypothetical protein
LDVCHLFVFDFDNPTVAKVFYQAAGKGEAGIVDTSIWIIGRFSYGGDLLVVETIDGAIVTESECLGVMTGGVKDANKTATRG